RLDRRRPIGDRDGRRIVCDYFLLALLELAVAVAVFGHFGAGVVVTLVERAFIFALLLYLALHGVEDGGQRRQRRVREALGQERQGCRQTNCPGERLTNGSHDQRVVRCRLRREYSRTIEGI